VTTIPTATGEVDSSDLGFTLMHEHVFLIDPAMRHALPGWVDVEEAVKLAVIQAEAAKAKGVTTLVDLTPIHLGRDVEIIRRVAEASGLNIVVSTGFYTVEGPWMLTWQPDRLVEYLLPEITEGIQGTGIRAGMIKCATDHSMSPVNEVLLRTAARLHRRTGVPISTHSDVWAGTGKTQQEVFAEEGVDLSRVVIGHCGDSADLEYLRNIMDRGSFLGMDRFGLDGLAFGDVRFPTREARVKTVADLCRLGYAEKLVLSHDYSPIQQADVYEWLPREAVKEFLPNWSWCSISDDVLPALKEEGVSESDIHTMTVGNPRRVFEANTGGY
jgi:phosphotriesterase-related protein